MKQIALCVHAYYSDVFEELLIKILPLLNKCDLFITAGTGQADITNAILSKNNIDEYKILLVENEGMDVFPFIKLVRHFQIYNYKYIIKLHTKNSVGRGAIHQSLMIDSVIGSIDIFNRIEKTFDEDSSIAIAGSEILFKPSKSFVYGNRETIENIQNLIIGQTRPLDRGFFAGTTFWIRGGLVEPLAAELDAISALQNQVSRRSTRTGDDGQLAHALERIWLELDPGQPCRVALTRPRLQTDGFELRVAPAEHAALEAGRTFATTQILARAPSFKRDFQTIKDSKLFDEHSYLEKYGAHVPDGFEALEHFITYGEMLGFNPSDKFKTAFYRLFNHDMRMEHNTLSHYLRGGRKERRVANPSKVEWLRLARRIKLYNPSWYAKNYADAPQLEPNTSIHMLEIGMYWGRAGSVNFDPRKAQALNVAKRFGTTQFLINYLSEHAINEFEGQKCVVSMAENGDYAGAEIQAAELMKKYGPTGALLAVLALCKIKQGEWDDALALAQQYWALWKAGGVPDRYVRTLINDKRTGNEVFSDVIAKEPEAKRKRVCVYTAVYGNYDILPPNFGYAPDVDFICFSDKPIEAQGWRVEVRESSHENPHLAAKSFKILPHKILKEYDYSLYVDGNTLLFGRLKHLIERYLIGERFVMWRHPERCDVYRELIAIIEHRKHAPDVVFAQMRSYEKAGLPENTGLVEASFIWREHGDPEIQSFMEAWWDEILYRSRRDQLSLGFLMWERNLRPKVLPHTLGNPRETPYFMKLPHNSPIPSLGPAIRTPVVFMFDNEFEGSGSTVMRGHQLSKITRDACPERSVSYSNEDHWSGRILFLTKGFLQKATLSQLARLKERRNILLADFVDAKPDTQKMPYIDCLVAASMTAFINYRKRWPGKTAFYVTHHVDPRIQAGNSASGFSAGYIGETVNAFWTPRLREKIARVHVDTSQKTDGWFERARRFNLHYAVRRTRGIDGFKPFLKGFVAARCHANIIIQQDSGDALYYLGPDYPFLLRKNPTEDDILEMIDHAYANFEGPIWKDGLDIMREIESRSSDMHVGQEIASMLRQL